MIRIVRHSLSVQNSWRLASIFPDALDFLFKGLHRTWSGFVFNCTHCWTEPVVLPVALGNTVKGNSFSKIESLPFLFIEEDH